MTIRPEWIRHCLQASALSRLNIRIDWPQRPQMQEAAAKTGSVDPVASGPAFAEGGSQGVVRLAVQTMSHGCLSPQSSAHAAATRGMKCKKLPQRFILIF